MSLHPTVRWAQRKQKVFITLGLRDIINERVNLKDNTLDFQCESHGKKYEFCVEFYEEIEQEKSQWNKTGFEMVIVLAKKDTKKAYWPRLTK
jgi:prostaglandin-E synthase